MTTARLLLFNGWGYASTVLSPLATALERLGIETCVLSPLPETSMPIEAWLSQLSAQHLAETNDRVWLGGWSLGGQIATLLAAHAPRRVNGLVTLCTTPAFTQRPEWPAAMPSSTFSDFQQGLAHDPHLTLQRFAGLCAQGSTRNRYVARQLRDHTNLAPTASLGLSWLGALDVRPTLSALPMPQLHVHADGDALVPAAAFTALAPLIPSAAVECRTGGHALPLETPGEVANDIHCFFSRHAGRIT